MILIIPFTIKNFFGRVIRSLGGLRWRLFLTYMLVGLVPLMFFAYTVSSSIEAYYRDQRSMELRRQGNLISWAITSSRYPSDPAMKALTEAEIDHFSRTGGFRVLVFDIMSVVIYDTALRAEIGMTYVIPEVVTALIENDAYAIRDGGEMMYSAVQIQNLDGEAAGAVLLMYPMRSINEFVLGMTQSFAMMAVLLGIITSVLVFFTSQLIIDPLRGILAVVQKMAEGHLSQRINITTGGEFEELSRNFNMMADQLESSEQSRQEFVSNVSHELKTPLSSMKVLSESIVMQEGVPIEMYREFMGDIISEVDRMTDIINELLSLVKLDATENAQNLTSVKVEACLADIVKRLRPLAGQKEIGLELEAERPVVIEGDEMKLSLALSNLVENAIKYTPSGGLVSVTCSADHANAYVTVTDNGIGIAEEDQQKVFERFYRVDKMRDRDTGGTGLGLAITHKTVLMHNGSIKVSSKEGEGATFTVRLPMRQR